MKIKCEFTKQETAYLLSALRLWQIELDEKENPKTFKDVDKLIKKVRKYLK